MRRPVRFTRASLIDRERLADFLQEWDDAVALRGMDAIEGGISHIASYPESGVDVGAGRREWIARFGVGGYVLRYRIDPGAVVVIRIFHTREDR